MPIASRYELDSSGAAKCTRRTWCHGDDGRSVVEAPRGFREQRSAGERWPRNRLRPIEQAFAYLATDYYWRCRQIPVLDDEREAGMEPAKAAGQGDVIMNFSRLFAVATLFSCFATGCIASTSDSESESEDPVGDETTDDRDDALKMGGGAYGGGLLLGTFGYTCSDPTAPESKPTCNCEGTLDCARMGSVCKKGHLRQSDLELQRRQMQL